MTTLTRELIEAGGTPTGFNGAHAWNKKQMKILGSSHQKGWIDRLIGREIPDKTYMEFILANPKCHVYELAKNWERGSE